LPSATNIQSIDVNETWKRIFEDLHPYVTGKRITYTEFSNQIGLSPSTILRARQGKALHAPSYNTVALIYNGMRRPIPNDINEVVQKKTPRVRFTDREDDRFYTIEIKLPKVA
jgi:transcriptional regulator with XRE-family HTH domain